MFFKEVDHMIPVIESELLCIDTHFSTIPSFQHSGRGDPGPYSIIPEGAMPLTQMNSEVNESPL